MISIRKFLRGVEDNLQNPAKQAHFILSEKYAALTLRTVPCFPFTRLGFSVDSDASCDSGWLVASDPALTSVSTRIPKCRRVYVISEPSPMNHLPAEFLNQFGILVCPYLPKDFKGFWFKSHPGLAWYFGAVFECGGFLPRLDYSQLESMDVPSKEEKISVIVSNKVMHDGHRRRLRFVELLQDLIGDRLVVFGRGIREISDKADAILPYAYHLSLENTVEESYWTEKLADSYLGYALPIYAGCPDVSNWFPEESLLKIDLKKPEEACDIVSSALENGLWAKRIEAIQEARNRILRHETIFDVALRAIAASPIVDSLSLGQGICQIRAAGKPRWPSGMKREFHRLFQRMTFHFKIQPTER